MPKPKSKLTKMINNIEDWSYDNYEKNIIATIIARTITFPSYFIDYLFAKADNPRWASDNFIIDWYIRLRCRIKKHSCGSIYYNPGGYEPDGRCKDCGDIIE